LPYNWLAKLLDHLRNAKQQFILRRSAGFAYSFLAIVGAEPLGVPPILQPLLFAELIALSGDTSNDWHTRVHALNILKLVIGDRMLAGQVVAHAGHILQVAVLGFEDARWAVRNSAMMVFSALFCSIVGDKKLESGKPAYDFLRRHRDFFDFVIQHFGTAVNQSAPQSSEVGQSSRTQSQGGLSPSLYPLLLLLSKLDDASSADLLIDHCIPLIMQCARLPNLLIRIQAAHALPAIIPLQQVPSVLRQLLARLPKSSAWRTTPGASINHNEIHGLILQAKSLLSSLVVRISSSASSTRGPIQTVIEEMRDDILPMMSGLHWLAGATMKCPPIREAMMGTLVSLRALIPDRGEQVDAWLRTSFYDIIELVSESATHSASSPEVPLIPGMTSLISAVLQWMIKSNETSDAQTLEWLGHPWLEVRKEALSSISDSLKDPGNQDAGRLRCAFNRMLEVLAQETDPLHLKAVLTTLSYLGEKASFGTVPVFLTIKSEMWPYLLSIVSGGAFGGKLTKVASSELEGGGLELLTLIVRDSMAEEKMRTWMSLVSSAAQPARSEASRLAANRSIQLSGVLAKLMSGTSIPNWLASCAVQCVLVLCKATDDDEEEIRDLSRNIVCSQLLGREDDLVPSCMIEQALDALASHPMSSVRLALAEGLLELLQESSVDLIDVLKEHCRVEGEDLTNRIFERDEANPYEERAVISFWAMVHLLKAMADSTSDLDWKVIFASNVLAQLRMTVDEACPILVHAFETSSWLGGGQLPSCRVPCSFHDVGHCYGDAWTSRQLCRQHHPPG